MIVHFVNLNNFLEKEYFSKFCLESWKKYMPDLEIKIWTENDDFIQKVLNKNSKFLKYFQQKDKNYGLLCDYLRLHLQYEFGGIYSELDQMLLKPFKFNENIEFCHSITMDKSITTSSQPNYFKKGNKILKYLIDEIDNNFDEYWLHDILSEEKKHPFYGYNEWSLCALRSFSNMLADISELKINSLKFIKENVNWCLHLSDWWLKNDKILVIDYNQIEDFYIENIKNTVYLVFYKNLTKFNNLLNYKCVFVNLKQKDIFIKFLKYKIYKAPELKNKFIDVYGYLGDINIISEKDFKIDDYTFPKY